MVNNALNGESSNDSITPAFSRRALIARASAAWEPGTVAASPSAGGRRARRWRRERRLASRRTIRAGPPGVQQGAHACGGLHGWRLAGQARGPNPHATFPT
eukprot:scaffold86422_cov63-Phaeocystis_antarctica.AAC.1